MNVPLLDLKAQYHSIKSEIDAVVAEVFESQYFILGPKVTGCERAIAEYCGCPHAVGVSSGTDALLMALMAEGVGAGDEVITSPSPGLAPNPFLSISIRSPLISIRHKSSAGSRRKPGPLCPFTFTGRWRRWIRSWKSPGSIVSW